MRSQKNSSVRKSMVSVLNYISFYDRDLHGTHPQLLTLHELFKAVSMLSTLEEVRAFPETCQE